MQNKHKGGAGLWILIIIAIALVASGVYFSQKNKKIAPAASSVTPASSIAGTTTSSSSTGDSKAYANTTEKLFMTIPSNWVTEDEGSGSISFLTPAEQNAEILTSAVPFPYEMEFEEGNISLQLNAWGVKSIGSTTLNGITWNVDESNSGPLDLLIYTSTENFQIYNFLFPKPELSTIVKVLSTFSPIPPTTSTESSVTKSPPGAITILSPITGQNFSIDTTDPVAAIPIKYRTNNIIGIDLDLIDSQGNIVYDQSADDQDIASSTNGNPVSAELYINDKNNQWVSAEAGTIKTGQYTIRACDFFGNNCTLSQPFGITTTSHTGTIWIDSILPDSGAVGTQVVLTGNFSDGDWAGPEYSTQAIVENNVTGAKAIVENMPNDDTATFSIQSVMCSVSEGASGKPCPSPIDMTPGTYTIYYANTYYNDISNGVTFTLDQ